MERADITAELVARLVGAQFPQWARLPVTPVEPAGWDNTTFRLGDELSARLPSDEGYVAQVDREHRWLPILTPHLPLAIPEPIARGRPGCGYPWPWSIYRWLGGTTAGIERITDLSQEAAALAGFLVALAAVDPTGGPRPGPPNGFRGGPLRTYDAETRAAIDAVGDEVDATSAMAVWDAALASTWDRPPVWVHGDVAPANLLVTGGRLSAVIDFGCAAIGDPACDLVMAWTFFSGASRATFRRALPWDDETWARGRGWALWKALITLVGHEDPADADTALRRSGWRWNAPAVVDEILGDHRTGRRH